MSRMLSLNGFFFFFPFLHQSMRACSQVARARHHVSLTQHDSLPFLSKSGSEVLHYMQLSTTRDR